MEKKNKSANNKLIGGRGGQRNYDLYKHMANELRRAHVRGRN